MDNRSFNGGGSGGRFSLSHHYYTSENGVRNIRIYVNSSRTTTIHNFNATAAGNRGGDQHMMA
jgi:glutamine amidotransferase-like uncharacterized protein